MDNNEIIRFSPQLDPLREAADSQAEGVAEFVSSEAKMRGSANELMDEIADLARQMGVPYSVPQHLGREFSELEQFTRQILEAEHPEAARFPKLRPEDWIISGIAGTIAILIDVVFVGTPEVVKIYHGGEEFDGSRLTAVLRKIGSDDEGHVAKILDWFCEKCKVPYDKSVFSGALTPNNHRLRSFAHDPFLGLFFAVADILTGTTTCIDDAGHLRVLPGNREADNVQKLLAVFYYIGHIVSDICTARGIPVPGFCLTQFFAGDGEGNSFAKMAEQMYKDGYDMRHLASASVPVMIEKLIVHAYLQLDNPEIDASLLPIAEREKRVLDHNLKETAMLTVSSAVASAGNLVKFLLPPNCSNPAALNLPQWAGFLKNCLWMTKAATRKLDAENALVGRDTINLGWDDLLQE